MKEKIVIFFLLLPVLCFGQGQVFTRNMRLQGYETKITKVVLCGNPVMDNALRDEVYCRWSANPYEFCSDEEYERLKTKPEYFFLRYVILESAGAVPDLACLQYSKGGPDNMEKLEGAFEVIRIPVGYMESGIVALRNLNFIPAYVDMIQDYLHQASRSGRVAYLGLPALVSGKIGRKMRAFSETDIAEDVSEGLKSRCMASGTVSFLKEEEWTELCLREAPDTVACIAIKPVAPCEGAVCYKMAVGADDHRLYYYSRHHIKGAEDAGFLPGDINQINRR